MFPVDVTLLCWPSCTIICVVSDTDG